MGSWDILAASLLATMSSCLAHCKKNCPTPGVVVRVSTPPIEFGTLLLRGTFLRHTQGVTLLSPFAIWYMGLFIIQSA